MISTDVAPSNIEQMRSRPELKEWVDPDAAVTLDFAVYNAVSDVSIHLIEVCPCSEIHI